MHSEPQSPLVLKDLDLSNFRFFNFLLAQNHLWVLYYHVLGLESLRLGIKYVIYLTKLALKQCVLSVNSILCSRIVGGKIKKKSESTFSENFEQAILLGLSSRYQRP